MALTADWKEFSKAVEAGATLVCSERTMANLKVAAAEDEAMLGLIAKHMKTSAHIDDDQVVAVFSQTVQEGASFDKAEVEVPLKPSHNIDGPPCIDCGNMTQQTGTCYTCVACGSTTGCG